MNKERKVKYYISAFKKGYFDDVKVLTGASSLANYDISQHHAYVSKVKYLPTVEHWIAELGVNEPVNIYTIYKNSPEHIKRNNTSWEIIGWSKMDDGPTGEELAELNSWNYTDKSKQKETKVDRYDETYNELIRTKYMSRIEPSRRFTKDYMGGRRDFLPNKGVILDYDVQFW